MTLNKQKRVFVVVFMILSSAGFLTFVGCSALSVWLTGSRSKFNFSLDYVIDWMGRFGSIIAYAYSIIAESTPLHQTATLPLLIAQFFSIAALCRRFKERVWPYNKDTSTRALLLSVMIRILVGIQIVLLSSRLDDSLDGPYVVIFIPMWVLLTPLLGLSFAVVVILPKDLVKEFRGRPGNLSNLGWLVPGLIASIALLVVITVGALTYIVLAILFLERKTTYDFWTNCQMIPMIICMTSAITLVTLSSQIRYRRLTRKFLYEIFDDSEVAPHGYQSARETTELSSMSMIYVPAAQNQMVVMDATNMYSPQLPPLQKQISRHPTNDVLLRIGESLFKRISSKSSLVKLLRNNSSGEEINKNKRKELARTHKQDLFVAKSNQERKRDDIQQVSSPKPRSDILRHMSSDRCKEFLTQNKSSVVKPEDSRCLVCCEAESNTVMMPCGHGGLCQACALLIFEEPVAKCFLCREVGSDHQVITDVLQYDHNQGGALVPINLRYH